MRNKILCIFMAAIFLICCFSGCKKTDNEVLKTIQKENRKNNVEKQEEKKQIIDTYDTFYLEGKKITLPILWSKLEKMGFKVKISDDTIISANEFDRKEKIYTSDERCLGEITLENQENKDIRMEKAKVVALKITDPIDIEMCQNISFLSSKKQVYEAWGEPLYNVFKNDMGKTRIKDNSSEHRMSGGFEATNSYIWCKNRWFYAPMEYNSKTEVYETVSIDYRYLQVTFNSGGDISEILFYFTCPDEFIEN